MPRKIEITLGEDLRLAQGDALFCGDCFQRHTGASHEGFQQHVLRCAIGTGSARGLVQTRHRDGMPGFDAAGDAVSIHGSA